MVAIINFINCGRLSKPKIYKAKNLVLEITISKIEDIYILIAKLKEHKLYGAKYLDFLDICKGVEIIKNKKHLTVKGKNEIIKLNANMNQRRKNFDQ
jgi:hypothetical protein